MSFPTFSALHSLVLALAGALPVAAQSSCPSFSDVEPLGSGTLGSQGAPELSVDGWTSLGGSFALRVENGFPGGLGIVYFGFASVPVPLPEFGATSYPAAPLSLLSLALDAGGNSAPLYALSELSPSLCGVFVTAQALVLDPVAAGGVAFTGALELSFGRNREPILPGPQYALDAEAGNLEVLDLDADGRVDLIVTDPDEQLLVVRRGVGGGELGASEEFALGIEPESLLAGDFDADGQSDFIVSAAGEPGLRLIRGTADGFEPPVVIPIDKVANDLASGDVTGDGVPDLFVGTDDGVGLYVGLGGGDFASPTLVTPLIDVKQVELADANSDGLLDVVVAQRFDISVFLGQPGGGFSLADQLLVDVTSDKPLAIGDVTGDGVVDLVVCLEGLAFSPPEISFHPGVGDGTFLDSVSGPVDVIHSNPILVDVDGDQQLEIVAGRAETSVYSATLFRRDSGGTFGDAQPLGLGRFSTTIGVADMDQDGDLDILAGSVARANVAMFVGDGSGNFPAAGAIEMDYGPDSLTTGDFDGDGDDDLLILSTTTNPVVMADFWWNDGLGSFSQGPLFDLTDGIRRTFTADVNQDGTLDLTSIRSNPDQLDVRIGLGAGVFAGPVSYPLDASPITGVLADFNGDGFPEVVTVHGNEVDKVAILAGLPGGSFGPSTDIPLPVGDPGATGFGDVDLDGNLDLIVSDLNSDLHRVWLGDGTGQFAEAAPLQVLGNSASPRIVDLTHDGLPDVLIRTIDSITYFPGLGGGAFGGPVAVPFETPPSGPLARDFDADGLVDLLVSERDQETLWFFPGIEGPEPLGPGQRFASTVYNSSTSIVDVDLDGRLDTVSIGGNTLGGGSPGRIMVRLQQEP